MNSQASSLAHDQYASSDSQASATHQLDHLNSYAHASNPTHHYSDSGYEYAVVPQTYPHQNYHRVPYNYVSTSVQGTSNLYPNIPPNSPRPQHVQKPTSTYVPNQASHHDSVLQTKHHSMDNPSVASASASASVSVTLAPVQALFHNAWTETQSRVQREVARTHAHYERIIAEERASAAEQLRTVTVQANDAQRFLMLSREQNAKLVVEIKELRGEIRKGKQKEKVEAENRKLVKVMQTQTNEIERLKDEWNVGQAVRMRLHGENHRLANQLEGANEKLKMIEHSFDEKVRAEFEVRLAKCSLQMSNAEKSDAVDVVKKMEDVNPAIKPKDE
ncbi:hypothetical protein L208DRAFT_1461751 [Tricholoma matsutake]|nr:hypothetical protein L208DRAFT_1461751 [Tricholoma matsutake 945]